MTEIKETPAAKAPGKDAGSSMQRRHGVQFAKFGAIGGVNTVVDLGVFAGLLALGLAPWFANIFSFTTANAGSYVMNSRFTFRKAEGPAKISPKGYAKFFSAHAVSLVVSTVIVAMLAAPLGAIVSKIIAIAVTVVWNYAASALLVFKDQEKH